MGLSYYYEIGVDVLSIHGMKKVMLGTIVRAPSINDIPRFIQYMDCITFPGLFSFCLTPIQSLSADIYHLYAHDSQHHLFTVNVIQIYKHHYSYEKI